MDPVLLTAISALGVSILTAAAQLSHLLLQNRHSRRQATETQAIQFRAEELKAHQVGVKAICTALQTFQDELLLMIRATDYSPSSSPQRQRIVAARDLVLQAFQQHHAVFDNDELTVGLVARERCVDVIFMLDVENVWKEDSLRLSAQQRDLLRRAALELSQAHHQLLLGSLERLSAAVVLPNFRGRLVE